MPRSRRRKRHEAPAQADSAPPPPRRPTSLGQPYSDRRPVSDGVLPAPAIGCFIRPRAECVAVLAQLAQQQQQQPPPPPPTAPFRSFIRPVSSLQVAPTVQFRGRSLEQVLPSFLQLCELQQPSTGRLVPAPPASTVNTSSLTSPALVPLPAIQPVPLDNPTQASDVVFGLPLLSAAFAGHTTSSSSVLSASSPPVDSSSKVKNEDVACAKAAEDSTGRSGQDCPVQDVHDAQEGSKEAEDLGVDLGLDQESAAESGSDRSPSCPQQSSKEEQSLVPIAPSSPSPAPNADTQSSCADSQDDGRQVGDAVTELSLAASRLDVEQGPSEPSIDAAPRTETGEHEEEEVDMFATSSGASIQDHFAQASAASPLGARPLDDDDENDSAAGLTKDAMHADDDDDEDIDMFAVDGVESGGDLAPAADSGEKVEPCPPAVLSVCDKDPTLVLPAERLLEGNTLVNEPVDDVVSNNLPEPSSARSSEASAPDAGCVGPDDLRLDEPVDEQFDDDLGLDDVRASSDSDSADAPTAAADSEGQSTSETDPEGASFPLQSEHSAVQSEENPPFEDEDANANDGDHPSSADMYKASIHLDRQQVDDLISEFKLMTSYSRPGEKPDVSADFMTSDHSSAASFSVTGDESSRDADTSSHFASENEPAEDPAAARLDVQPSAAPSQTAPPLQEDPVASVALPHSDNLVKNQVVDVVINNVPAPSSTSSSEKSPSGSEVGHGSSASSPAARPLDDDRDDYIPSATDLPEEITLPNLDLGVDVLRTTTATITRDPKKRPRLILWWWWDSKKRRWVLVFTWAMQQLQPWMDQIVVRDLGWAYGTFEHHVAVACETANSPHSRIRSPFGVPLEHTFQHVLDKLLPLADAIIGIGIRGFGTDICSLAEVLERAKPNIPVLATRYGGRAESYRTTAKGLREACVKVARRFGYAPSKNPLHPTQPMTATQISDVYFAAGGAKGLAEDDGDVAELIALDLLSMSASRVEQGRSKKLGNLGGNAERFPTQLFPSESSTTPGSARQVTPQIPSRHPSEQSKALSSASSSTLSGPSSSKTAPVKSLASMMIEQMPAPAALLCTEPGCRAQAVHKRTKLCAQHEIQLDVTIPDEKKHQCPKCAAAFAGYPSFEDHMKTVHGIVDYFQCDICGQTFGRHSNLDAHVRSVHGSGTYGCSVKGCTWRTNSHRALEPHERYHARTRRQDQEQTCHVCEFTASNKGNLDAHKKTKTHRAVEAEANGDVHAPAEQRLFKEIRRDSGSQKGSSSMKKKKASPPLSTRTNELRSTTTTTTPSKKAAPKRPPLPAVKLSDLGIGLAPGALSGLSFKKRRTE